MKRTLLTSCSGASRSLNNTVETSFTKKGIIIKEQSHHRIHKSLFVSVLIFISLLFAAFTVAQGQETGKGPKAADLLRQDILYFAGPTTEQNGETMPVPADSYLIRLTRKTLSVSGASSYSMIVRKVDQTEQSLLQDAVDGKWDSVNLLRASLVVEGIRDENQIRRYEARIDAILEKVNAELQMEGANASQETLTRKLFEALHRKLLTKEYSIDCTHLAEVFETGHFNCVSATVLFNVLALRAGLDVVALEMPGHALSRVRFVDRLGVEKSMNLETTAPNWFALQNEEARNQATVRRVARPIRAESLPTTGNPGTEFSGAEATGRVGDLTRNLREITPVQLIATIYYNQGVDLLNQERFAEAALANIKALHLDSSSETAWGNLMATFNNWAIKLSTESKRYDLGATLLDHGVYLDPNYDKFKANQLHIYYHWIRDLATEGRIADAQTVFTLADRRLPGDRDLDQLMRAIQGQGK